MPSADGGVEFVMQPAGKNGRTPYDKDVILRSQEQAPAARRQRKARAGQSHGLAAGHLLKRSRQPENRTSSWRATISDQRKRIALAIKEAQSLKTVMRDRRWQDDVWLDALAQARKETGFGEDDLPESCPWLMDQAPTWTFGRSDGDNTKPRR